MMHHPTRVAGKEEKKELYAHDHVPEIYNADASSNSLNMAPKALPKDSHVFSLHGGIDQIQWAIKFSFNQSLKLVFHGFSSPLPPILTLPSSSSSSTSFPRFLLLRVFLHLLRMSLSHASLQYIIFSMLPGDYSFPQTSLMRVLGVFRCVLAFLEMGVSFPSSVCGIGFFCR